jgi:HK97 family phage portal protein
MGIFSRLESSTLHSDVTWIDNPDFWSGNVGPSPSGTGLYVSPENAIEVSTVYACLKVIAETLAMLPLIVYHRTSDTAKERATDQALYRLLKDQPNAWQTAFEFKETMQAWALLYGIAIAIKQFDFTGELVGLKPIHPSWITPEQLDTGRLRFRVRSQTGPDQIYTQDEVFCIRGLSLDTITGLRLSRIAREAIGIARAMEMFSAKFFANDATVGMVLEHPGTLSDLAHTRLSNSFSENFGGVRKAHRPKVLEEGMKLTRLSNNAKEAQLTEARQAQVIEICRFFRIPPHKIAHLLQATFSNIEHQAIEFVTDTMMPWGARWEQAVTRDLIVEPDQYVAEFLWLSLLRGDVASRYAAYAVGRQWGWLSINDVRQYENLNPIEGGDGYLEPLNMVPLGTDRALQAAPQAPPSAGGVPGRQNDSQQNAAIAMSVLFMDAASRIANAEMREVSARAEKRADDPARFVAWAKTFYATHAEYVAKTLAPLTAGYAGMTGTTIDTAAIVEQVIGDALAVVCAPDVNGFDDFLSHRKSAVFARLRDAIPLVPKVA